MQALSTTEFQFPDQQGVYHGKVRDVYHIGRDRLIMVASDRISAFDHILPRAIPYKGQVLNQVATHFLQATTDIVPNWLEYVPDPNVAVGKRCQPIMIEMVIRGYLAGHAWREYRDGKRMICGVEMPDGMRQNERFPTPIITPATKAEEGHDEDISAEEILRQEIVTPEEWQQLAHYTRALFERGTAMARERGLILVDTKYEFGKIGNEIILMDEIHTPDSSRYFYADSYDKLLSDDQPQRQLSKEFVREWLMDHGFTGKEGQVMPDMPDDFVAMVSERYIELYEQITGATFVKVDNEDIHLRIYDHVVDYLQH